MGKLFDGIGPAIERVLVVPISSALAARSISTMRKIKTYLHLRLTTNLDSIERDFGFELLQCPNDKDYCGIRQNDKFEELNVQNK